jgi:membrane associated rhomboid family serine protease
MAALLAGVFTDGASDALLFSVYRAPLSDAFTYLRAFAHILGHADIEHYVGNFMIILLIGPMLEEKYGSWRILVMLLITAVTTGILYMAFFPGVSLRGASGAAFTLIVLSSFVNVKAGRLPLTFVMIFALYVGRSFFASSENVAVAAHVVGGLCGAVFGFLINRAEKAGKIEQTEVM